MKKVIVFGAFDNLHEGHIHMLKEAKEYGDFLIVVVGRDAVVTQVKGKKPVYSEDERLAQVEKLNIADKVRLAAEGDDRYRTIAEEKPDIVALGFSQRRRAMTDTGPLPKKNPTLLPWDSAKGRLWTNCPMRLKNMCKSFAFSRTVRKYLMKISNHWNNNFL